MKFESDLFLSQECAVLLRVFKNDGRTKKQGFHFHPPVLVSHSVDVSRRHRTGTLLCKLSEKTAARDV